MSGNILQFPYEDKVVRITRQKNRFYYKEFVCRKFEIPITEFKWKREFNLEQDYKFIQCYRRKIRHVSDKQLAFFNFKILPCGSD